MKTVDRTARMRSAGKVAVSLVAVLLFISVTVPLRVAAQRTAGAGKSVAQSRESRAGTESTSPGESFDASASQVKRAMAKARQLDVITLLPLPANADPLHGRQAESSRDTGRGMANTAGNVRLSAESLTIATPLGTTYNVQHAVGVDLHGTGQVNCFPIFDEALPGAPDDIVSFDGVTEDIRTDVLGTVPTVVEWSISNGDGTDLLVIDTSSPFGTDLFPSGLTVPDGTTPLVDGCFSLGFEDPLDWNGMDSVTEATISFLRDDVVVEGPFVLPETAFSDPWNGRFGLPIFGLAGRGVNRVHLEIVVGKIPSEQVAACCRDGECLGDTEQANCLVVSGQWNAGATCGADPIRPEPICAQTTCSFDNGLPLDDGGGPSSQFAPNQPFSAGAADDFILLDPVGTPCRITHLRTWVTHFETGGRPVDPTLDYQGLNVTIYANSLSNTPGGRPELDGTHSAARPGGVVHTQTIPMSSVTAVPLASTCLADIWQLDVPVAFVLNRNTRYWLEIQPILDSTVGEVLYLPSRNINGHPGRRIFPSRGVQTWQQVNGNANACPSGDPPTPAAATHTDLAFQLFGEEYTGPLNDDCSDAVRVEDGAIAFSNLNATIDGPDEADRCGPDFGYSQIGADVWYEYTTTCTGELTASLCGSGYDTKMALYAGCGRCPPQEESVACSEDFCNFQSEVSIAVVEGDCYQLRVGGYGLGDVEGTGTLTIDCPKPKGACCAEQVCLGTLTVPGCETAGGRWFEGQNCGTFTCPLVPPLHDECVNGGTLETGTPYEGTSRGSGGGDVTSCADNDVFDVWHRWTAYCTGTAKFDLCDATFNTTLAVFDDCDGNELACSDNDCNVQSRIAPPTHFMPVISGETYYLRVSGAMGEVGNYTLLVDSCTNACCFPSGFCAVGTPEECASVDGTLGEPGSLCLGDSDQNGIDDVCEFPSGTWFWRDYNGPVLGGYVPDYDQNKDYDNADQDSDPSTGVDPYYGGPTAVANSLWWFADMFPDVGIVPPQFNKIDLIEELAVLMGTNGTANHPSPNGHPGTYAGTFLDDLVDGIGSYLTERGLSSAFNSYTIPRPPFEFAADKLINGQDVNLLLGFYQVEAVDQVPDGFVVHWSRTGGHYVTMAGVDLPNLQIAIADPDADMAEDATVDYVRRGDHDHDRDGDPGTKILYRSESYDHAKHNDKGMASHDVYDVMQSISPGGSWIMGLAGDPFFYGQVMSPFHEGDAGGSFTADSTLLLDETLAQLGYPTPTPGQIYTVIEAAVLTEPTSTVMVASMPGHEESLWRSENNIVRITFADDISLPPTGGVLIREMLPVAQFGPDLSDRFSFTVENDDNGDPRVLAIREVSAAFSHRKWFAIANPGDWFGVAPFELQYQVQVGDASHDERVFAFDVSVINGGMQIIDPPDDERRDIDGDGRIAASDTTIAGASIPSLAVPKPSGH